LHTGTKYNTRITLLIRLDLLVKLQYESNTIILFVDIRYVLCVNYFLTSITIPDPRTSDMRQTR